MDGYQPPGWPGRPGGPGPQRYHLDLRVQDMDKAVAKCLELGGARPDFQPGGDRWQVLTDPAGHPFCLCPPPTG